MTQQHEPVSCGDDVLDAPQSVLAAALEAYVCITADGRVIAWNPAAQDTFGFSRAQACGRRVEELIIPERFRAAHRAGLTRVAAGEPGRVLGHRLQLTARHRDGHEFPVEMTLTVTDTPPGRRFHAFAHDVTLADRARRFAAVETAVSLSIAQPGTSTAAAHRVTEAVGMTMSWPVVELWLLDETRQMLTCAARWSARTDLGDFAVAELDYGVGLPGAVCSTRKSHWISDLGADRRYLRSRAAAREGLRVAVGVPISSSARILGALCVYGEQTEDPEDSLLGILGGVAAHVGQFLDHRRAEELAVELARTKDEFLALVTHELRNPLAIISNTAALLDDEIHELDADGQRNHLRVITRNAQRLAVMADDLLDLARLESGGLSLDTTETDLSDVIGQAVQAIAAAATDKRLTIDVDLPDTLPLHADADRMRQVADNLLSNAVKYTPAGGRITVTALTDGDHIEWTVSDTGIGIPAQERPRLFRRFYRASTALQHQIKGTGLGLVITRTILERHHGTIELSDHERPGTTFVVQLPVKPPMP